MAHLILFLLLGSLLGSPLPAFSHVILDPELVHGILVEVANSYKESREGPTEAAKAEAIYHLGEKVEELVLLMNQDLTAHGQSDLFARLLVKRLEAYEIKITFSETQKRYMYDLAAFREYLKRAPKGKRAPEARFRVIAQTFYETLGTDPSKLVNTDLPGLMRAVDEEERFLKEYPRDGKTREVRFFLGVDYYRLYKNLKDPDKAKEYKHLSQQALEAVMKQYAGTMEARAAEALLEGLRGSAGN
ncbi:MAG: hypothetical protein HY347_11930 [candidate division NC10 bacterium]|nr:hypothetical protein [candidate division NC10 bacterium]